ncbi:hypothetical protein J6590_087579, partial [Homalodisca vitripennis]
MRCHGTTTRRSRSPTVVSAQETVKYYVLLVLTRYSVLSSDRESRGPRNSQRNFKENGANCGNFTGRLE